MTWKKCSNRFREKVEVIGVDQYKDKPDLFAQEVLAECQFGGAVTVLDISGRNESRPNTDVQDLEDEDLASGNISSMRPTDPNFRLQEAIAAKQLKNNGSCMRDYQKALNILQVAREDKPFVPGVKINPRRVSKWW